MEEISTLQKLHLEHFGTIRTQRLLLRPFTLNDAEAMFAFTRQPQQFSYLRGQAHESILSTNAFLEKTLEGYRSHEQFLWGITLEQSQQLVGSCRLFDIHIEDRRAEVSYMLNPTFGGQGIMSEAICGVIQFAMAKLGINRVQARCAASNLKSERVMQNCGMSFEGTLKAYAILQGESHDFKLYAIVRKQNI